MNSLGIKVMPARDGGLVVYESVGNESEIVFCGDQKAVNEYIAKRVGALKAETTGVVREVWDAGLQRHIKESDYQRTAREFATDAIDLKRIDEVTRYAVEA